MKVKCLLLTGLMICINIIVLAQALSRESLDVAPTRLYEPEPRVVIPGTSLGQAPSDAIILFDGKNLNQWTTHDDKEPKWELKNGILTVVKGIGSIFTKQKFGDVQLHIEWRAPSAVTNSGQERGNSGVYLQQRYELQVLDNYENKTYVNGQAGSLYKQSIPLVNANRKPGEWQAYDIIYTAPRFSDRGTLIIPGYMTVFLNGILIQNHFALWGPTEEHGLPVYTPHGKESLMLQEHGDAVSYRNIWVREL